MGGVSFLPRVHPLLASKKRLWETTSLGLSYGAPAGWGRARGDPGGSGPGTTAHGRPTVCLVSN